MQLRTSGSPVRWRWASTMPGVTTQPVASSTAAPGYDRRSVGGPAHGDDAAAGDGHGAVGDHVAVAVHGHDVATGDEQVGAGGRCDRCRLQDTRTLPGVAEGLPAQGFRAGRRTDPVRHDAGSVSVTAADWSAWRARSPPTPCCGGTGMPWPGPTLSSAARSRSPCSASVSWCGGRPTGALAAADDRCPHREAPLSAGTVVGPRPPVPVPRLDLRRRWPLRAGAVGRPRRRRAARGPCCAPVHAAERYGLVWLCLDEPVGAHPRHRRGRRPLLPAHQPAGRAVGGVDDPPRRQLPRHRPLPLRPPRQLRRRRRPRGRPGWSWSRSATSSATSTRSWRPTRWGPTASGQSGATVERRMSTGFALPFLVRSTIEYATGLRHTLLLLSAPIDDDRPGLHLRRVAQRRLLGAGRRGHRASTA